MLKILDYFKKKVAKPFHDVWACDRLLGSLVFDLDAITPCCVMPHNGELNISFYDHQDYGSLIDNKVELMRSINNDESHLCRKCKFLKKYDKITLSDFATRVVTFTFDKTCNLRCSYCFLSNEESIFSLQRTSEHKNNIRARIAEIFEHIPLHSLECVMLAGGEPFLLDDFEGFYEQILALKPKNIIIFSNLTRYRSCVRPKCGSESIQIVCSLDAGTSEIYSRIKKRDSFTSVVANIRRYAAIDPQSVYVKYLFTQENSSRDEVDAFFEVVRTSGAKQVILSLDAYSTTSPSEQQLDVMNFFIEKAQSLGFTVYGGLLPQAPELEGVLPQLSFLSWGADSV